MDAPTPACPQLRDLDALAHRHGGWDTLDLDHTLPALPELDAYAAEARAWTIREAGIRLTVGVGYARSRRTGRWQLLYPTGSGPVVLDAEDDSGATVDARLTSVKLLRRVLAEPYDYLHGDLNGPHATGAEWLSSRGVRCRHSGVVERGESNGSPVEWCLDCGDQWSVDAPEVVA